MIQGVRPPNPCLRRLPDPFDHPGEVGALERAFNTMANPRHGSGLIGLMDRVEAIGGSIQVDSPVEKGTSLLVTIPIERT